MSILNKPNYRFLTSAKGGIDFAISDLMDDYGVFQSKSDAVAFAKRFMTFSVLWLEAHGYGPVRLHIVPRWNLEYRAYGYKASEQDLLRERIFADFLSPLNMGKSMLQWQGLATKPTEWYTGSIPKT